VPADVTHQMVIADFDDYAAPLVSPVRGIYNSAVHPTKAHRHNEKQSRL
jgi:hypothetical protein